MPTVFGQGNSAIKSIQRGFTVIFSGDLSATATITEVDISKSALTISSSMLGDDVRLIARGTITDSTTLTFTRGGLGLNTSVNWEIVEYN